ncbi:fimbrial protein [Providencia hangzhouensis]|uniref:fimbrial protein n=1 Tax=Providencia hangzhouensis TaxID=3031799 RepID=UPI0034DD7994
MKQCSTTFFFIAFLFQSGQAFGIPAYTYNTNSMTNIEITGPADQIPFGEIIKNSGSRRGISICNSNSINYTLGRIEYQPIAHWNGQSYQASPSHPMIYLFETGISGFSFSPIGGFNESFVPLPVKNTVVWEGSLSNNSRIASPIKVTIGVFIYKGPDRIIGSVVIPSQKMYRYACYDDVGNLQEIVNVQYNPITVNATVSSCAPTNKIVSVEMEKIPASIIEKADASENISLKRQSFSLQCDPNINVYVSIVDLSDTTNKTTVSTLTADSSASGVGYAVIGLSGQRLQFGPDGSAPNIPGQQKYYIQRSGTAEKNNPISFSLGFGYVRKPEEEFKTGTANAMIGLTYSYQ